MIEKEKFLVKIKTWDQMVMENRVDEQGDIVIDDGYAYFTKEMEEKLSKIPNRIVILKDYDKYRYPQWETEYDLFDVPETIIEEKIDKDKYPEYFVWKLKLVISGKPEIINFVKS